MDIKPFIKKITPSALFMALKWPYSTLFLPFLQKRNYNRLHNLIDHNPEINELFPAQVMHKHYVYEPMRQTHKHPDLFLNQIRYYRIYKFFSENYSRLFDKNVQVIDVGDTSGILFRAMKRSGLSANINPDAVAFIKQNGIEAEVADIEDMPFPDKSFEYAFCFQCIEHVANPIQALKELNRITREKVFLSIPYVENTVIYSLDYGKNLKSKDIKNGGWSESAVREKDCHKFEFSTEDFKKILSYSSLKYCNNFPINYFKPLGSTYKNEGSYFNFFILEPV